MVFQQVRTFLVNLLARWTPSPHFLQHVSVNNIVSALARAGRALLPSSTSPSAMNSPHDSKAPSDDSEDDVVCKRRMVHLKTKEECRLSNETIQVWTVELPSKHAEGILRCVYLLRLSPCTY